MILAEKRVYEVVFIVDPAAGDEDVTRLIDNLQHIITEQGGAVTKNETMGRRRLAYNIGRNTEGIFQLFEVEGSGREIAELERRMRVNDQVLRYLTVRVDEDRRRAEKFAAKRARRAAKRPVKPGSVAAASTTTSTAIGEAGGDEA